MSPGAVGPLGEAAARDERKRLASIAADSWYGRGANAAMIRYAARVFRRLWRGASALELGPAEGIMTEYLAADFPALTVVDGAEAFLRPLRVRHPRATVVRALFEEWETGQRFDTIVVSHVLEHVERPVEILARVAGWLAPGGRVFAAVPNARSLHRQAAVLMGLLREEHELNETDIHHGHRRVYDPETFRADVAAAGLRVEVFGGYWIKPISNAQIEATWTPQMIAAFMELGERYPDIAAELYVVAGA